MAALDWIRGPRGGLALALAVLIAAAVVPATARGAVGSLSNPSCINDVGLMGCASNAQGMSRARSVAIAPDGTSLYVAAWLDDAVVEFNRDPMTGALSGPSCIEDPEAAVAGCGVDDEGLRGAADVAVSPTGNSVYVVSFNNNAIVRFDRNVSTGALSWQGCIEDDDVAVTGCASNTPGLGGPRSVVVSPNGAHVYVATGNDPTSGSPGDDAVVKFNRDAAGALTSPSCIEDPEAPTAGCASTAEGLNGAQSVAISPSGNSVYLAAADNDAVVRFDRDNTTGVLSSPSCIEDPPVDVGCGASNFAEGLDGASSVAVSPDGASAYVASRTDNSIVGFSRDTAGALSGLGCIEDPPIDEGCAASAEGLAGAIGVTVGPLSDSVHVASFASGLAGDNAVVSFGRGSDGGLTTLGCFEDPPIDEGCGASAQGLMGAYGVTVGPESRTLYVASEIDDAVVRFDREIATVVPPPAPLAPAIDPAPETTIGKGPKRKARARRPSFTFGSNEVGTTFLCTLLGKRVPSSLRRPAPCASPFRLPRLAAGKKLFQVSAVDAAGNVDPTPALFRFKILR